MDTCTEKIELHEIVKERLVTMGRTAYWLSKQIGVTTATMYRFLQGTGGMRTGNIILILNVLHLKITPEDRDNHEA